MLGNIGVLLGLALLIALALRGTNIFLASLASSLVVAVANGQEMAAAFSQHYAGAMFGFAGRYFFLFLAGAVFGRVMAESHAATSLAHALADWLGARRALTIVVMTAAVLTYGGVNVFIVVFAIYPLGLSLVHRANIPKRLLMAAIGLGAGTFTMTALPGSPSIQNVISAENLGTSLAAAPLLGVTAGVVMAALGLSYLEWQRRRAAHRGDTFRAAPTDVLVDPSSEGERLPNWLTAALPLVLVIATILVPLWVAGLLGLPTGEDAQGAHGLARILIFARDRQTLWPVVAMALGTLLAVITMRRGLPDLRITLSRGAETAALPLLNTAAVIGFGGVVGATQAFQWFANVMVDSPLPPLVSAAISVNIVAGIVGSASGGLGIWMPTLAKYYLGLGVPPAILHRVVTIAAGGFDTLPHCGVVITFLTVMGLTHREAYKDTFMVCVAVPVVATAVVVVMGMLS